MAGVLVEPMITDGTETSYPARDWMTVSARAWMMSSIMAPRLRSFSGLARPCSTGPMLTAYALRCAAL